MCLCFVQHCPRVNTHSSALSYNHIAYMCRHKNTLTHSHANMYHHTRKYSYSLTFKHTNTHTHIFTHTHKHSRARTYRHIYIYMHEHENTHICRYKCKRTLRSPWPSQFETAMHNIHKRWYWCDKVMKT